MPAVTPHLPRRGNGASPLAVFLSTRHAADANASNALRLGLLATPLPEVVRSQPSICRSMKAAIPGTVNATIPCSGA